MRMYTNTMTIIYHYKKIDVMRSWKLRWRCTTCPELYYGHVEKVTFQQQRQNAMFVSAFCGYTFKPNIRENLTSLSVVRADQLLIIITSNVFRHNLHFRKNYIAKSISLWENNSYTVLPPILWYSNFATETNLHLCKPRYSKMVI